VGSQSEEAEHPPPAHVGGPHNPAHGLSRRSGGERHRWRPQKCPAATWLIQHTGGRDGPCHDRDAGGRGDAPGREADT
jgi:hypothetical protein